MKVLILADINSPHTQKWVRGLLSRKIEVLVFSLRPARQSYFGDDEVNPIVFSSFTTISDRGHLFSKLRYLKALPSIRSVIRQHRPDVLHAHYATSYGLLGALSGFKPFCISVWGSDVYVFPSKSIILAKGLKYILSKADMVFSTSHAMEIQTRKFYDGCLKVIPFGISLNQFSTAYKKDDEIMRFAVVKTLSEIYNIHLVVAAFVALADREKDLPGELHIAGDGHLREKLEKLAGKWLNKKIFFYGNIPHLQIPAFLETKHVLFNVSEFESFGVSVIEASAMKLAVVTSGRGGLIEVVKDQVTGIILNELTLQSVKDAMLTFFNHPQLVLQMGLAGRDFIATAFDFEQNLDRQVAAYTEMLNHES